MQAYLSISEEFTQFYKSKIVIIIRQFRSHTQLQLKYYQLFVFLPECVNATGRIGSTGMQSVKNDTRKW